MCNVEKKKKKKKNAWRQEEMPAAVKQRGCQLSAWLTSGNTVSACRHTVSNELSHLCIHITP